MSIYCDKIYYNFGRHAELIEHYTKFSIDIIVQLCKDSNQKTPGLFKY